MREFDGKSETDGDAERARTFGFRFRCRRSGNCCARPAGVVRVTDAEVGAMAAARSMSTAGFRSRFVDPRGDRLRDGPGGRCPMLADGAVARCTVYEARPAQCRSWPYWPGMRIPAVVEQARRFCPGIELLAPDEAR